MRKSTAGRDLFTEALAIRLGLKVDGKTGTVDGVELAHAEATLELDDAAATNRVALGVTAGVAGVVTGGLALAPLALLGLKKKDNRTVRLTVYGNGRTLVREFPASKLDQVKKLVQRINK